MSLSPFPFVTDFGKPPEPGSLVRTPKFCFKADRSRCAAHYSDVSDKPGPHKCPYGFSTHVVHSRQGVVIFSGIRIIGHEGRKESQRLIEKNEYSPHFPADAVEDSANGFGDAVAENERIRRSVDEQQARMEELDQTVTNQTDFSAVILHEVRRLNGQLKQLTESLIADVENATTTQLKDRLGNIFATSTLISVRLDAYDFETNPELALSGHKVHAGVYKKFQMVTRCLTESQRLNKVSIKIAGSSFRTIEVYPVFNLLPYVLLENAIKYSPEHYEIQLNFEEGTHSILVTVTSFGPLVEPTEVAQLCNRGYRGTNSGVADGTGIGLYLAKNICDAHNIEIEIQPGPQKKIIGGIPYGEFTVVIRVPQ